MDVTCMCDEMRGKQLIRLPSADGNSFEEESLYVCFKIVELWGVVNSRFEGNVDLGGIKF